MPSVVDTWVMVFLERQPEELVAGFMRLLETWKPEFGRRFPTPGDLTAILDAAKQTQLADKAEQAWQLAHKLIADRWRGDLGWIGEPPEAGLREALAAAGGVRYLASATAEQLVWAKKEFIAAYFRREKIGDLHQQGLLAEDVDPEVKKKLLTN